MFDDGLDQAAGLRRLFAGRGLRGLVLLSALPARTTWLFMAQLLEDYRVNGTGAGLIDLFGTDLTLLHGVPARACVDGRAQSIERSLDVLCARQVVQRVVIAGPAQLLARQLSESPAVAALLVSDDAANLTADYAAVKGAVADLALERIGLLTPAGMSLDGAQRPDAATRARLTECVRRFIAVQPQWLDDTDAEAADVAPVTAPQAGERAALLHALDDFTFELGQSPTDPMMKGALMKGMTEAAMPAWVAGDESVRVAATAHPAGMHG